MDWLSTLLSSAVIAAAISFWSGEKTNRLKYITSERSKWREEIKEIAGNLSECQFYDERAKRLLTDLKLRINAYGRKNEYPSDICLRFFSDEHIWKEISAIENRGSFVEHKDRILRYLELLLKFDWERSKSETKSEQKIPILAMIFLGVIMLSVFVDYVILKGNSIGNNVMKMIEAEIVLIAFQVIMLLIFLFPSFVDYAGFSRKEYSYNEYALEFASLAIGEFFTGGFWIWAAIISDQYIYYFFCYLELVLGLPLFIQEINKKRNYREYSNNVMACFTDEPLMIYTRNFWLQDLISMFMIEPKFNNCGITYKKVYDLNVLNEYEAENANISWRYMRKFAKWKKNNPKRSRKEFLLQYPKACKIFVKRGTRIVYGYSPKEWNQFANRISQN